MKESTLAELVSAMDIVVMEQNADLSFACVGRIPEWFTAFNPEALQVSEFRPDSKFAFLTNFLMDAEKFWAAKGCGQLPSGPWLEHDDRGHAVELQATAVMVGQKRLLLLEKLSEFSRDKQALIQKALELQGDYRQWQKMRKALLGAYADIEVQLIQRTEKLRQSYEGLKQEIGDRQRSPGLPKQNEIFLHSIFDAITDGMIIIDPDFYILRANLAMANIWGRTTPLEKQQCFSVWQGRSSPCPWCTAAATMNKEKIRRQVILCTSNGGALSWLKLVTFPLRNDKGQVIGVIEYFRDITGRRRTEAPEPGVRERLQPAGESQAPGPIPRGLSHNFNNILNTLLGYMEMALLSLADPRQAGETELFLEEAFRAEELAKDLIRQI